MKVYGYARVSAEEQVKSGSLNQQIDKIKDYCHRNDHQLLELFIDAGVSAIKERPEYELMDVLPPTILSRLREMGVEIKGGG